LAPLGKNNMGNREVIYALLSRIFSDVLDKKAIEDLKNNQVLLQSFGSECARYFEQNSVEKLYEELNTDFSTTFLIDEPPIEAVVLENKEEVQVGLQNPLLQFYTANGYSFDLLSSNVQSPDHLSVELAFMQNLINRDELDIQRKFLKEHLALWAPPYLLSVKNSCITPFYRDVCDFGAEFIISDYSNLVGF